MVGESVQNPLLTLILRGKLRDQPFRLVLQFGDVHGVTSARKKKLGCGPAGVPRAVPRGGWGPMNACIPQSIPISAPPVEMRQQSKHNPTPGVLVLSRTAPSTKRQIFEVGGNEALLQSRFVEFASAH